MMFEEFKTMVKDKKISDDEIIEALFEVLKDEVKNKNTFFFTEEDNLKRLKSLLRPLKSQRPELFTSLEQMFRLVKRAMKQLRNG